MESKGDIKVYEKDGIKFMYKPLEINSTEGLESSTTLKAMKDIDSYIMTIRASDVEKLLPIAKNDVGMFNRIVVGFLSGELNCKGAIKMEKEVKICVNITLDVFGTSYEVKLVLNYENVGEMISLKRKVEWLTEELERANSVFRYYMFTKMSYVYDRAGNVIYKENLQCNKFVQSDIKNFVESKEYGIIKEFSNYELLKLLEKNSLCYKSCVEKFNDPKGGYETYQHPFIVYYVELTYMQMGFIDLYLTIINAKNYELIDLDLVMTKGPGYEVPYSALVTKTKDKYKYVITHISDAMTRYPNYEQHVDNSKKIWMITTHNPTFGNGSEMIFKVEKIKL